MGKFTFSFMWGEGKGRKRHVSISVELKESTWLIGFYVILFIIIVERYCMSALPGS
jgi:hypothetical protein